MRALSYSGGRVVCVIAFDLEMAFGGRMKEGFEMAILKGMEYGFPMLFFCLQKKDSLEDDILALTEFLGKDVPMMFLEGDFVSDLQIAELAKSVKDAVLAKNYPTTDMLVLGFDGLSGSFRNNLRSHLKSSLGKAFGEITFLEIKEANKHPIKDFVRGVGEIFNS